MKVRTLDDVEYTINLSGYVNLDKRPRSQLHIIARQLIKEIYPTLTVAEEVPIKILRGKVLYLDFYIPLLNTAIEVHGEQHYNFSSFYHKSAADFMLQKKNDQQKATWCDYNTISLVVFPYFEDKELWRNKLSTSV
jgi:hypothetical protein